MEFLALDRLEAHLGDDDFQSAWVVLTIARRSSKFGSLGNRLG